MRTRSAIRALPPKLRMSSSCCGAGRISGYAQTGLRQILVCPDMPTSERRLTEMKSGELRWSERDHGWEVFIPSVAFRNANSSLPDLGELYRYRDAYVTGSDGAAETCRRSGRAVRQYGEAHQHGCVLLREHLP